jgi:hypothetical protein
VNRGQRLKARVLQTRITVPSVGLHNLDVTHTARDK